MCYRRFQSAGRSGELGQTAAQREGSSMRWALLSTRKQRIGLLIGALCVAALVAACSRWRVWTYGDLSLYLRLKYHSRVAQALWRGDVRPGDRLEQVIAVSRPNRIRALGPFVEIDYYPTGDPRPDCINLEGTVLIAKEGRLIAAGSYGCTFQRHYFDIFTTDERALYAQLLRARIDARSADAK
jgi:hypothetical protein